MKGIIRAKGVCPNCRKPFSDVSRGISMHKKLGFICIPCKIVPQRFYVDLFYHGKRIRIFSDNQGLPLNTYHGAVNLLGDINYEINNNSFDPVKYHKEKKEKFLISDLLDRFYIFKMDSIAPSYRRHYKRYVEIAREFFQSRDVKEISRSDLDDYRKYLENNLKISEKTIKNIIDFFKTFLNYCRNVLRLTDNVPAFPEIDVPEYKSKSISTDDRIAILEHIPVKNRQIFRFLLLHGCRISEARALKCKDIDLKTQTVKITATFSDNVYMERRKGRMSKFDNIRIHTDMLDFVKQRVKDSLPEDYVFVNPRTGRFYTASSLGRIWLNARKKADVSGF